MVYDRVRINTAMRRETITALCCGHYYVHMYNIKYCKLVIAGCSKTLTNCLVANEVFKVLNYQLSQH